MHKGYRLWVSRTLDARVARHGTLRNPLEVLMATRIAIAATATAAWNSSDRGNKKQHPATAPVVEDGICPRLY